jgi:hypothetical protein
MQLVPEERRTGRGWPVNGAIPDLPGETSSAPRRRRRGGHPLALRAARPDTRTKVIEVDMNELARDVEHGGFSVTVGCVSTTSGHVDVIATRDGRVEVLAEERLFPDDMVSLGDTVDSVCRRRRVAAGVTLDVDGVLGLVRLITRAQELTRRAGVGAPPA